LVFRALARFGILAGVAETQLSSVTVKVLIADDHAIFRQGLRVVLGELDPAVEILEAADFGEALRIAKGVPALSLLLADLRMPEMDGFEGLRALRRLLPRVPIMVLSASEEAADLFGALESGASGYLSKSAPAPVILEALDSGNAAQGKAVFVDARASYVASRVGLFIRTFTSLIFIFFFQVLISNKNLG